MRAERAGDRPPPLQRQIFRQAFREDVVRVVVRVDEPRDHELARGVDRLDVAYALVGQARRDGRDRVAFDQDIAHRRLIDVAGQVEDAAASNQQFRRVRSDRHHLRM